MGVPQTAQGASSHARPRAGARARSAAGVFSFARSFLFVLMAAGAPSSAEDPPRTRTPSPAFSASECYLCCEGESAGPLVRNVCHCHGLVMHLHCQQRMLEAAYARGGQPLQCGVCHARYANADSKPVWRLSLTGALWCMCPLGVLVMVWSASTVLDRGAANDPRLSYSSAAWWRYQIGHLTWWRIIGIFYLFIAMLMALVSVAWLVLDVCARSAARRALGYYLPEPLCVRRRLVFCFDPAHSRPAHALILWRQWSATLLPCGSGSLIVRARRDDGEQGATVLL